MSMFCFQCQEAAKGTGCTVRGVCGKTDEVANLQDVYIHVVKTLAFYHAAAMDAGLDKAALLEDEIISALFTTITNVNFDADDLGRKVVAAIKLREDVRDELAKAGKLPDEPAFVRWNEGTVETWKSLGSQYGVMRTENEDVRSLRELLLIGLKGMAAYAHHAAVLGYRDDAVIRFMDKALLALDDDSLGADELVGLVMECGSVGVTTMALLDKANTETYGNPEITEVSIEAGDRPGILISGHDLKDLEELLEQSVDAGIDIYTHGEMLPAHYYPAFKKYSHFKGNYGNAWWKQVEEFEAFAGPILMTTNCLVPPPSSASYMDKLYTTGTVRYPGAKHIEDRKPGGQKDFSLIIEQAKTCQPPKKLEQGSIVGGFAHAQVKALAGKVVDAVKQGKIKKFVVMAGCDGRFKTRNYYTEFASALPADNVILTAGCAKYRYNKLNLGDIDGIPRVLDAGQCNDSYSLAVTALALKNAFGVESVNELPIVYNIAWYEQKAVIVLLALLSLGVKNIHLGPTLPAFLSPGVAKVLVENFGIGGISTVEEDIKTMIG
ncbi:hydroxylamine reductase [Spirochaetia bacterium 38H-sp]|uniref:Hydroxylamine reductase n=1 Tax=Rarispira pelagica TaxID=3141764 RepID=A0ABU9U8L1_9SPIR